MKHAHCLSLGILWSMLLLGAVAQAESITYHVDVNTSTLSGSNGFVEFQFANGVGGSEAATATITNLSGGTLTSSIFNDVEGDVSGNLPGPLAIGNTTSWNDVLHGFTFGSSLRFNVTFSGPALDSPNPAMNGSQFSLFLWDDAFNQLLGGDPFTGAALLLNVNPNGSTNVAAANPAVQANIVVPEPASLAAFAAGLAGLWGGWCLRTRGRAAA